MACCDLVNRGAAYDLWNDLHTATLEDYAPRPWEKAHRPNLTGTYEARATAGEKVLRGRFSAARAH